MHDNAKLKMLVADLLVNRHATLPLHLQDQSIT
jgi:hypothetical protein